jgi:hypothetical protein
MPTSFRTAACAALAAAALAAPALADEKKEEPTLSEIVNILHEKGLIDDEQHQALAARAAKEEQAKRSWTDRISLFGDLRARFEWFDYDQDIYSKSTGVKLQDRDRGRYRARLGLTADLISRAAATLQLATGGSDPRSGNQTIGSGNDFDKDEIRVDLAYATLTPTPKGALTGIDNGYLGVDVGKVKNPFIWKLLGADNMLIDNDINPEGASLRVTGGAGPVMLFANGGIYVIDENAGAGTSVTASKDPKLAGGQLGGSVKLASWASLGARGTLYHFFSLDDDFFARGVCDNGGPGCKSDPGGTGGNLVGGLSRRNGSIQVAETSAFVTVVPHELVPVTFYGSYSKNLSARNSPLATTADREDKAWTVGVTVGDPVRLVRIGAAYYYVEANAFPSMYLDSDVLDGTPNRTAYMLSLQRQLFENVDLGVRAFLSDRIEGGTAFVNSGPASDRVRGQADLSFKF